MWVFVHSPRFFRDSQSKTGYISIAKIILVFPIVIDRDFFHSYRLPPLPIVSVRPFISVFPGFRYQLPLNLRKTNLTIPFHLGGLFNILKKENQEHFQKKFIFFKGRFFD
jgi:hypothetical protein